VDTANWLGQTMTFEEDKRRTLNRIKALRIMNYLGMVAWHRDVLGGAKQKLRLMHPLGLIWLILMISFYVIAYGLLTVSKDIPHVIREDTVWW